jgi:small subunit ribosomal protein S1
MYRIGDEVDVYVMKVDPETKKIALSLRRAQPEEWDLIVDKYQVGRVVPGMVTKLVTFGAFARIEGPVEGLIHVSELVDRRIAHPKEVVREGDLLPLKIVRIERDRHRLGLSLREAREDGERMGFKFTDAGEVIHVPDDVREEFEQREGLTVPPRSDEPRGEEEPATDSVEPSAMADAEAPTSEAPAAVESEEQAPSEEPSADEQVSTAAADPIGEEESAAVAAVDSSADGSGDQDGTTSGETPADS